MGIHAYRYDPPIEVLPGDEIRSRCVYNSRNQREITYWGVGSYDEMCIVFLMYYPGDSLFSYCGSFYTANTCSFDYGPQNYTRRENLQDGGDVEDAEEFCDLQAFSQDPSAIALWQKLSQRCDPRGRKCRSGCQSVINKLRQYPCLKGFTGIQVEGYMAGFSDEYAALRNMLHSCDTYDNILEDGHDGHDHNVEDNQTGNRYDPDTNNLPVGGECPFGEDKTGAGTRVYGQPYLLLFMMMASYLVLHQIY